MNARKFAMIAGLALVSLPLVGSAQTFGSRDRLRHESDQNWALEFRIGPYLPNVDREFGGRAQPYADIYGTTTRVMFGLELDWQAVRIGPVMTLGLGGSISYFSATAKAPLTTATLDPNAANWGTRSADDTGLQIVPFNLLVVARIDGLARHVPFIPLVPYGKLGLSYGLWWVTSATGLATASNGDSAVGGSLGWHAAVGVSLMLDVFQAQLARQFDSNEGVNHSYLFIEASMTELAGFTGRAQLNVGSTTWNTGLMFEF